MIPSATKTLCTLQKCFTFLLVLSMGICAQSFEGKMTGTINNRNLDLYIWVDVVVPKDTGAVTGTYFYKTVGKEIYLAGKKSGSTLYLTEFDKKKKLSGTFRLLLTNDTLQGFWLPPDAKDSLRVKLYRTNPAFKETAKLPNLEELFADQVEMYSEGSDGYTSFNITFARHNLLSVIFSWENYKFTARFGSIISTYDLSSMQEVNLLDGITKAGRNYISSHIGEQVLTGRSDYSDSEWMETLSLSTEAAVDSFFNVNAIPERSNCYLDHDSLVCTINDFCEQSYAAGNREMTFDVRVVLPLDTLRTFITKESILQNVFQH